MSFFTGRRSINLLMTALIVAFVPAAYAEMTAEQHYERCLQEIPASKFEDALADCNAAIQLKPDYWKAYGNRGAAEYYLRRYSAALNDINTARAHLPLTQSLEDFKVKIEQAINAEAAQAQRVRAVAALNSIRNAQLGLPGGGVYGGGAAGITELANTVMRAGHRIPADLVHPMGQGPNTPSSAGGNTGGTYNSSDSPFGGSGAAASDSGTSSPISGSANAGGNKTSNNVNKSASSHAASAKSSTKIAVKPTATAAATEHLSEQHYIDDGNAKVQAGDFPGAIAAYDQSIRINPNNGVAYIQRGSARLNNGDTNGAVADFDKAVELMPDNPAARDLRDKLKAALEQIKQQGGAPNIR